MIKRNPSSRNQRSKGFKVKHVLQVILLLGVCFWLIYQVKHNHDKKKEFDKNDTKVPIRTETDQILKLGRKDLHPGKVEVDQNEKHEEEEEDEHIVDDAENKHEQQKEGEEGNKHETEESEDNVHEGREEQEEEENKHGAEEQEQDENKSEEVEDEGGEVEIDENDHEKSEVDNDRDDEVVDEEKDKDEEGDDETENEDKEDEEKGGLVENHGNHEAREEHYKADDASSAVTHDTHATSTETETVNLEHVVQNLKMNIEKPVNETTYHSDESNRNQNDSDLKVTEGKVTDTISSNATAGKETGNDSLSNETAKTNTDSHLDVSNNLTAVITEASSNSTGAGDDTSNSSEQNITAILSESDHAQNVTVNTAITGDIKQSEGLEKSGGKISEGNMPGNDSMVSVKPENGVAAPVESSTLGANALEKTISFVASNGTDNMSSNLERNAISNTTESDKSKGSTETSEANETQNIDANEDDLFKADTQTGETDEKSDTSSVTEILDSVENDAIDSSDTHNIHEDMAKARTDLDTLPDIRNEGNDSDENAAE